MEGDFRNTLIIISAVIIAAIFIHGFITIRKNKNPYKLKATNEKVEPVERGFDGSGFDQDGVSKPRVIQTHTEGEQNNTAPQQQEPIIDDFDYSTPEPLSAEPSVNIEPKTIEPQLKEEPQVTTQANVSINEPQHSVNSEAPVDLSLTETGAKALASEPYTSSSEIGDEVTDLNEPVIQEPVVEKSLYDTPVSHPKPEMKESIKAKPRVKKKATITKKEAIKRNQIELNFGEPLDDGDMPSMSAIDDGPTEKQQKLEPLEPEVLAVSIVMPEGFAISGAALLPSLLTLGLRFGEMDIFHRHEDNAGNGKVTFSLANMMNPGTFDLDELETFTTRGLTLFMTLPNAGDAFEVFEQMLGAAKQISVEFGAQLLDDKRSVMTKQTEQHYKGKIREFERKNRIAFS